MPARSCTVTRCFVPVASLRSRGQLQVLHLALYKLALSHEQDTPGPVAQMRAHRHGLCTEALYPQIPHPGTLCWGAVPEGVIISPGSLTWGTS